MAAEDREVPDHPSLVGRLRHRLRAHRNEEDSHLNASDVIYRFDSIAVDAACHGLRGPVFEVRLTRTEWDVLGQLIKTPGHVVSHDQLITAVWGSSYAKQNRLLHDTISRLRRRFQDAGLHYNPIYNPIETIHGVGYRLI